MNNKPYIPLVKNILATLLVGMTGVSFAETTPLKVTGNVVFTHQATNESHIQNETAGSADRVVQRQYGSGNWLAHVEASSTPKSDGVSAILYEANADAGSSQEPTTALDDTDQYELFLRYTLSQGLFLTGDVQRIVNSNYGVLPGNRNQHATVYGARLTWLYE